MSVSPGKSQKESQEDQGGIKELGGTSPSCFKVLSSSWPSFWLFPGLLDNPSSNLILRPAFPGPRHWPRRRRSLGGVGGGRSPPPTPTLEALGPNMALWVSYGALYGLMGLMEPYGVLMGPYMALWALWSLTGPHGALWGLMGPYGLPDNPSSHLILRPVERNTARIFFTTLIASC